MKFLCSDLCYAPWFCNQFSYYTLALLLSVTSLLSWPCFCKLCQNLPLLLSLMPFCIWSPSYRHPMSADFQDFQFCYMLDFASSDSHSFREILLPKYHDICFALFTISTIGSTVSTTLSRLDCYAFIHSCSRSMSSVNLRLFTISPLIQTPFLLFSPSSITHLKYFMKIMVERKMTVDHLIEHDT